MEVTMVYVLVIILTSGLVCQPDRKIAGVYQDEASCEKYRNTMALAVKDLRVGQYMKFSCDPWKIEKD